MGLPMEKAGAQWHDKVGTVTCEAAHVAYRQNYMDLDPTYTDNFGDPLLRLTLDWTDHEKRQKQFLAKHMTGSRQSHGSQVGPVLHGSEDHYWTPITRAPMCRAESSWAIARAQRGQHSLQHWQMPNLWITGGCTFPQNESANPTLTILAVTYRAADAFVDRYLKNPGALA